MRARLIAASVSIGLAACAGGPASLIPIAPFRGEADAVALQARLAVPLVIIGDSVYLPPPACADPEARRLAGADENRALGGDEEGRRLGGDEEGRRLGGDDEGRRLGGDDEGRRLGGDDEGRRLGGDDEGRRLGGDDEGRRLGGDDEGRRVGGDEEGRTLGGETEGRGLGGEDEGRRLAGEEVELLCEARGRSAFRVLNYERLSPRILMDGRIAEARDGIIRYDD